MNKKYLVVFIILFFIISIVLGFAIQPQEISLKAYSEQNIINNCENLSVINASYCLRDNIRTFYIYNLTDDDKAKELSFEEIKANGTDCGGWSYFYERLAKELDFGSTTRGTKGLIDVFPSHRIAVIWDDENYCKLDQLNVRCYKRHSRR